MLPMIPCQLSVILCQLSVILCQLSVILCQLSMVPQPDTSRWREFLRLERSLGWWLCLQVRFPWAMCILVDE
jgi:hypothetical protein